jgi:hypothetical protein
MNPTGRVRGRKLDMADLGRRARGRSRDGTALLPVRQELGFGLVQAGRAPARDDPERGIDVHRDRPEPPQFGLAVPIFIEAPHVAAVLQDT